MEDNIVSLPFAGLARRVYQRSIMSVKRSSLAVRIRLVVVGIEHLDLVAALKVNAAVPSSLAVSLHLGWSRPFYMQLHIAEFLFCQDSSSGRYDHCAAL